ncbi:MAG: hypothetical protein M0Z94_11485 [Dehalococcoidales bacterium]|nr:hypothetical protein [Dehalococcoidales bacterium]
MRLLVDHISLVQGARRHTTPGIGISEPRSLFSRRSAGVGLYSLCALDGAAADEVSSVLTEALHAEFSRQPARSVTSRLVRAIRSAEVALASENDSSLPQHRCSGSICAAAVRDGLVYLAYVGGCAAYLWQDGAVRLLGGPDGEVGDSWQYDEWEVGLSSCSLGPGDAVILSSAGFRDLADEGRLAEALSRSAATSVVDELEGLHALSPASPDFTVLVLQNSERVTGPERPESRRPSPVVPDEPEPELPESEPLLPTRSFAPIEEEEPESRPAAVPRVRRSPREAASIAESEAPPPERKTARREAAAWPSWLSKAGLVELVGPSLVRVLLRFSIAAIVIAALAIGLYVGEEMWHSRGSQAKADELLSMVEQKERDALAATDAATRRWLLTEASRFAEQAVSMQGADPKVTDAAARIRGRLDEMNGVTRLTSMQLLADFVADDKSSKPSGILVGSDGVYVLDQGVGAVWFLNLASDLGALGPPKLLWRPGDGLAGVTLGEATATFWMYGAAPGLPEQVYALDSNGILVKCSKDGVEQSSKLTGVGALPVVRTAAGQAGNLYVLDTQRRLVWRYVPGGDGYDRSPQEYLTGDLVANLGSAVDMVVDGSVYLLLSDGQVAKYTSGRAQPFPAVVPDTPLRNPVSIFATPSTRYMYVADPANARVVRFTKEGEYVNQYKAPNDAFDSLRAVFVDEEGGRLYAVTGTRALAFALPVESTP